MSFPNIIMISSPGGGKGTVSKKLAEEFDYTIISVGEILRKEKSRDSEIGKKIKHLIGKGNLIPDEITNEIVEIELSKNVGKRIILDGYPRTTTQAKFLDTIFNVDLVMKNLLRELLSEVKHQVVKMIKALKLSKED